MAEAKPLKWITICAEDKKPLMVDQSYFVVDEAVDRQDVIDGYHYGTSIIPYSSKYQYKFKTLLFILISYTLYF